MPAVASPGYRVRPVTSREPPTPLRTDVAGFVGRTAQGPTGVACTLGSGEEFDRLFGQRSPDGGHLSECVRGYFVNGGVLAYVTAVASGHPTRAYHGAAQLLLEQPQVALLVAPDVWGDLGQDAFDWVETVANGCHRRLDRMLLLGLPSAASRSQDARTDVLDGLDRALRGTAARAVAVYHPWLVVETVRGSGAAGLATVPPTGAVAGMVSRVDRERGPSRSPANEPLADVVDVDGAEAAMDAAELYARGVNPVRCTPGRGLQVWGARTFDRTLAGRYLAHRRLLHRMVRAARRAGDPLVFESHGFELRLALARTVRTVLLQAYRSGALAGRSPDEAFAVRCDESTTLPADEEAGRVVCEVRFTPADPIEEITVHLALAAEGRLEVIEQ